MTRAAAGEDPAPPAHLAEIRWLTAFIDRPVTSFDAAANFWTAVTASKLSPCRGQHDEFATLLPHGGDPYLRIQRVGTGGGSHLDVHVDDLWSFAEHALTLGAQEIRRCDDVVVLRSPAGFVWCAVPHEGERDRPAAVPAGASGAFHLVDQLCIDVPSSRYEDEYGFWADLTGWTLNRSSLHPEFHWLTRPQGCPLRVLLQQRNDEAPASAHLDLASTDVGQVVAEHVRLGAVVDAVFPHWTVLVDPSGSRYCVTARNPTTGALTQHT